MVGQEEESAGSRVEPLGKAVKKSATASADAGPAVQTKLPNANATDGSRRCVRIMAFFL
jgi:hypothetical protein